jgi:hypothetical protein
MEVEKKPGSLREAMPGAAALVDQMRAAWGAEFVDRALRNGVRLQRAGGSVAAITVPGQGVGPTLRLCEAGQVVGALPVRLAGGGAA